MEYKTIVDKDGYVVDLCVIFINGQAQYFEIKEGQQAVEQYKENFIKPHWNGEKWEEKATEEEIKECQENNKTESKPSLEERISLLEDTINYLILGGNQ